MSVEGPPASRQVFHLFMFQAGSSPALAAIERGTMRHVARMLQEIVTPPKETEIHLWIDSPGGDAHAAYKLALALRQKCAKLVVVVPDYAKSAATLLALAADELHMAVAAELGPLDAQIEHPDRENEIVSALDVTNALSDLASKAVALADYAGSSLIPRTQLPRSEVLPSVLKFSAKFFQPLMKQLDPTTLHEASVQLAVAERYALQLLTSEEARRGLATNDPSHIIHKLVNHYPTHGFVIDRAAAHELGLRTHAAEEHPRWESGRLIHERFEDSGAPLLALVADEALYQLVDGDDGDDGDDDDDGDDGGKGGVEEHEADEATEAGGTSHAPAGEAEAGPAVPPPSTGSVRRPRTRSAG